MFAHFLTDVRDVVTFQSVCLLLGFCLSVENETGEIVCELWSWEISAAV